MLARHLVLAALSLSLLTGCSQLFTPHQAYAPLLHRRDQLDVDVRMSGQAPAAASVAARVAYAATDGVEIVAGADAAGTSPAHVGGMVGVGTFVTHEVLRLEAIGGLAAGWARTDLATCFIGCSEHEAIVEGAYAMPFGQIMAGFELRHFVLAAGVRFTGYLADTHVTRTQMFDTSRLETRDSHARLYVEPILTIRIPLNVVRVDFMAAVPLAIAGGTDVHGVTTDASWHFYFAVGLGFRFDLGATSTSAEQSPDPDPAPDPEAAVDRAASIRWDR